MRILGLQKLTLLDYPGKMACTVFTGGCNFRCPFCHNAPLVTGAAEQPALEEAEFFRFLGRRTGILEGVCITGGEPTLQPDLEAFIRKIRKMGFAVKLDTNGYRPQVLISLAGKGLLDYVAMDIKSAPDGYARASGLPELDLSLVQKSIDFLMQGDLDFEFRTTVTRELHTPREIAGIGAWIAGEEKYFLQAFSDSGHLIADGFHGYDKNEMLSLLKLLKGYLPNAEIRGV